MTVKCKKCGKKSRFVSSSIGFCSDCIKLHFPEIHHEIMKSHASIRKKFGLPELPPKRQIGTKCNLCINECKGQEGENGFCGLPIIKGRDSLSARGRNHNGNGTVHVYYDELPTNCVADWVCPAGSNSGYPEFSYCRGPEYGYKNLAVFYGTCNFDCLFCQNWQHKQQRKEGFLMSPNELADMVDEKTACICFFGGDPTPLLPHAIITSRLAIEKANRRVLRICWETNGSMSLPLLEQMVKLSLNSGGCIKFDLKAYTESIHIALTGITNKRTLENFAYVASYRKNRPNPPLLIASTLLVPGYIDEYEIGKLAGFISGLGRDIPYSLLAFCPNFYMDDLPATSRAHAIRCFKSAKDCGLENVHIGNMHLLSL